MTDSPIDERLVELAERTRAIAPLPGFQARVVAALAARAQATVRAEVVRSARFFVPAALVLAAVTLGIATRAAGPSSADIVAAEQHWEHGF